MNGAVKVWDGAAYRVHPVRVPRRKLDFPARLSVRLRGQGRERLTRLRGLPGVYRFTDARTGAVLYVGMAADLARRIPESYLSNVYGRARYVRLSVIPCAPGLEVDLEAAALHRFAPPFNKLLPREAQFIPLPPFLTVGEIVHYGRLYRPTPEAREARRLREPKHRAAREARRRNQAAPAASPSARKGP